MSLVEDIISGKHDADLRDISDAVGARFKLVRSQKNAVAMVTVKVGDIGVLTGLTPKHINGREVKIMSKKQKRLLVEYTKPAPMESNLGFSIPAQCFKVKV